MIDIEAERLIDLKEACRLPVFRNPKTKKAAHFSSIYRHILRGARDARGERVKLETIRTPGGLRTSVEAVERFIRQLTTGNSIPSPTTKTRRRQMHAAEKELAAAGFDLA
jgi:Protein of unknown function (DUF1580)